MRYECIRDFKKGLRVIVVNNQKSGHCFNIGTKLKIVKRHESQPAWYCRKWIFGLQQVLREDELDIVHLRKCHTRGYIYDNKTMKHKIMEKLTEEQIQAVIYWMNNCEQLKDTIIPLRFKEDWTNQLNLANCTGKPPLGLKPKWVHDQQRQGEILAAINRYLEARKTPPKEWALEFASYCV